MNTDVYTKLIEKFTEKTADRHKAYMRGLLTYTEEMEMFKRETEKLTNTFNYLLEMGIY